MGEYLSSWVQRTKIEEYKAKCFINNFYQYPTPQILFKFAENLRFKQGYIN